MTIFNFLTMLGGLSLFLYGMNVMGNSLSKMAGGKLETILEKLTSKRIMAVLLGAAVTAVIQSSSATTVMVVGFVNSGMMSLSRAVGVIMGANIGTTITSWILSLSGISGTGLILQMLKPSSFSPILAAVGIIMTMTSKDESKKKDAGNILLGFAILMFGMETMSGSVSGLADNEAFTGMMTAFSNPLIGMAIGTLLTAIIQSSSASVGILQALCLSGAVPYSVALPIIMGQNIGTCITSIISAVGANRNAKRAAMIHLYFNLIGTCLFMAVFYTINIFVSFTFLDKAADVAGIALIHSLFNIGATIVLFPFSNQLVRLSELTIRDKKTEKKAGDDNGMEEINLDERFLERPAFAMELCRGKARHMAQITNEAMQIALETLIVYDEEKIDRVKYLEDTVDRYEDALGTYLVKLSGKNISKADSQTLSIILHSISDFERISDHARSIVKSADEIHEKGLAFSKSAKDEIEVLSEAIRDVCNMTTESFCDQDLKQALHVEPLERAVDSLTKRIKEHHIKRLQKGKCTIEMGFILEDILNCLERVSDHCSNIAACMITVREDEFNTHEYIKDMSRDEQEEFWNEYHTAIKRYRFKKDDDKIKA